MSRVRFVMEIEVADCASSFRPPSAAFLNEKMNRVLRWYQADPARDPAWTKSCKILRTVHLKNDGSKTAV